MQLPSVPHSWRLTPAQAIAVQRALAPRVSRQAPRGPFRFAAGVDAAFSADGKLCVAAVVLWDMRAREEVESCTARRSLRFPYIPGLLSFREAPAILAALRKLRREPDVLMCDGQGLAHPRRLGIACHVGLVTGRPAIGCAKSRLTGEPVEPGRARGAWAELVDRGEVVGCVLRTRDGVKPLFVSIGHRMNLPTARRLVLRCGAGYRLPEPTRRADHLVTMASRESS